MHHHYILDDAGNVVPCDLMTWARWFENVENRRVAFDEVGDYQVSTIFLGLDHSFDYGPQDPLTWKPVLWESIIFDVIRDCKEMLRYRSREAALAGHAHLVELARKLQESQESQLADLFKEVETSLGQDSGLDVT